MVPAKKNLRILASFANEPTLTIHSVTVQPKDRADETVLTVHSVTTVQPKSETDRAQREDSKPKTWICYSKVLNHWARGPAG